MRSRQQPARTYQLVLIANFQVVEHSRLVQVTELGAGLPVVFHGECPLRFAAELRDLPAMALLKAYGASDATLLDSFTHLLGASLRSSPRLAGLPTEIRRRRRQRVDLVLTVRR